jgi:uncharacterized SAM-binding protein YcdF (DUF218 family)
MMETWLIALLVALAISLAAGGYYLYRRRTARAALSAEPLGYIAGGENYMITLGIGTPAEITAFILFGLTSNPNAVAASRGNRLYYRNIPGRVF